MADQLVFDLDRPTPNVALERLRQAVLGTDDAYLLIDMLLSLVEQLRADVDIVQAAAAETVAALALAATERDELRAALDALAERFPTVDQPTDQPLPEEMP